MRKLLSALKDGPRTPSELRTAIDVRHRQTFRENCLNPAIRADLICAENGLSPHDPRIRYSLTDKGTGTLNEVTEKVTEPSDKVTEKVTENTSEVTEKRELNDVEKRIVGLIQENPHITQKMLSEKIGFTRPYIARTILALQARGVIRRIGPDKGGEWMIVM